MHRRHIDLNNFFVEYDYTLGETRLNLVVIVKETTDYIELFSEFEKLYPTQAITLTNQLNI